MIKEKGKIIFLIGLHGVGKTSIAKIMENKFGCSHISIGDIGRSIRKRKIPSGLPGRLVRLMAAHEPGKIIDDDLAESIIHFIFEKSKNSTIVIDGFPSEKNHIDLIESGSYVIKITCKEEERFKRLKIRSENTERKWSNGIESARDQNVNDVMHAAINNPKINFIEFSNHESIDLVAHKIANFAKLI